jgi:putative beta barrel porin BBP7
VGIRLTSRLELHAGYSILYWNNVLRPGQLVDNFINPERVPRDQFFNPIGGAPRPSLPGFPNKDMWIQGANFGISYQF